MPQCERHLLPGSVNMLAPCSTLILRASGSRAARESSLPCWDLSHMRVPSTCWLAHLLRLRPTSKVELTSPAKQSLYPYPSFRRSYQLIGILGPNYRDTIASATALVLGNSCSAQSPTIGFIETSNNGLRLLISDMGPRARDVNCWPSRLKVSALSGQFNR